MTSAVIEMSGVREALARVLRRVAGRLSVSDPVRRDDGAVITPYVAFVFSEKIVVRAGIPVTATRVCSKAALVQDAPCDPLQAPTGSTALQWTVPASVA